MADTPHRIALLTSSLRLGGTTTFLVNFAGELVRRQIPAEVFCFEKDHPLANDFRSQHIPVYCLDERRMIFEDRLETIRRKLACFRPTVVLANLGPAAFEVLRYVPPGILRVGTGQSDDGIVYDTLRLYSPHLDAVAVVSRAMQLTARSWPELGRLPVHYLPYGVPLADACQMVQPDTRRPLRILYLGRLEQEQKRVRLFPQIWQLIRASGIPCHWTIAGDGSEMPFLKASLKNDSPQQTIAFLGAVPYAEVPAMLQEHDVFLLASDYEGLPLSLLEAMSHGLVPVVSDLKSGIPEVVDTSNGLLVPVNKIADYAHAIIHLHQHRDELAVKSAAARARVQQEFSVAAMTDRWLATFPLPPSDPAIWPSRCQIAAPLAAKNTLRFSLPMRMLRRMGASFRK